VRRPEGVQQAARYVERVYALVEGCLAPAHPADRFSWLGVLEQVVTARERVQAALASNEPVLVFEAGADATSACHSPYGWSASTHRTPLPCWSARARPSMPSARAFWPLHDRVPVSDRPGTLFNPVRAEPPGLSQLPDAPGRPPWHHEAVPDVGSAGDPALPRTPLRMAHALAPDPDPVGGFLLCWRAFRLIL